MKDFFTQLKIKLQGLKRGHPGKSGVAPLHDWLITLSVVAVLVVVLIVVGVYQFFETKKTVTREIVVSEVVLDIDFVSVHKLVEGYQSRNDAFTALRDTAPYIPRTTDRVLDVSESILEEDVEEVNEEDDGALKVPTSG